jgi:ERCC4-type nuclease
VEFTIEKLFTRFKSLEGIRTASMEELAEEIGRSRALKIQAALGKGD